ncbi:hypothetical protein AGMMS49545_14050 [Betaproteobacteria bacterium]|nr:hypothetical protein AGMMS49545_14050 [Betaproteobacteria bacterium]GHU49383.1 hypothetical protein AGMMS50289_26450 [Betaproteobacteria bacterium]
MLTFPLNIIGYVGLFFSRIIKSAISREREYLADAAAVQYTRNPDALAGTLRKISRFGSQIAHPRAEVVSHMFFGAWEEPSFFSRWFATHPSIGDRLARLKRIPVPAKPAQPETAASATPAAAFATPAAATVATSPLAALMPLMADIAPIAPAPAAEPDDDIAEAIQDLIASAPLAHAQSLIAALPPALLESLATTDGAQAAVYALLLDTQPEIQEQQLDILRAAHSDELAAASQNHAQWLAEHSVQYRLPLLDLSLPGLRELYSDERKTFMGCVNALIRADGRLSASEFAFKQILQKVLLPSPVRPMLRLEKLDADIACLLAYLAYTGGRNDAAAIAAYQHASPHSPMSDPRAMPDKKTLRPEAIIDALSHLTQASRPFREKFLNACVAAIEHDGKITVAESELLRAFAQSLDCPAPLVVPDSGGKAH